VRNFSILLLSFSIVSFGQKKDSIKLQQVEFIKKVSYAITSNLFKERESDSKLIKDYILPWKTKKYTEQQLQSVIDTLMKNTTIKVENSFSKPTLKLDSYFPEFIEDLDFNFLKFTIKESFLKYKNKLIDIEKKGSFGFGSRFASGYENEQSYSHNWRTVHVNFNIKNEIEFNDINGSVLFNIGIVKGYNYIKINSSDIGKKIKIGDISFTIIDIFNNTVIIDVDGEYDEHIFEALSLVNLTKKGEKITSNSFNLSTGKQTLYKDNYDIFKTNPDISFEEYKEMTDDKFSKLDFKNTNKTEKNPFGKRYIAFTSADKLINVYLYSPVYIENEFSVTYSKDQEKRIPTFSKPSAANKKIHLMFEEKKVKGILIGNEITLLDKNLKSVKKIRKGTIVNIIGTSLHFYNNKKEDYSCSSYKYVKINYKNEEYIVAGKHVLNMKQVDKNNNIEILKTFSPYLKDIKPTEEGIEFCDDQNPYSPIILHNIKKHAYSLIHVVKDDLYKEKVKHYKKADFFQAGGNSKTYDNITKIEFKKKEIVLFIDGNGSSYKVKIIKKKNNYFAKYFL